jgi:hypothetical protein
MSFLVLHRMGFGRYVRAIGAKPGVAWYSGIRVPFTLAQVYVGAAFLSGIAGILLSSSVRSYVPMSGNAFLLDAIGATFIGTALSPRHAPDRFWHDPRRRAAGAGQERPAAHRLGISTGSRSVSACSFSLCLPVSFGLRRKAD